MWPGPVVYTHYSGSHVIGKLPEALQVYTVAETQEFESAGCASG